MTEIKTKLVKCKICGEIFDASLEKCPVCNAGPEFFEPIESEDSRFRSDTQQRYLSSRLRTGSRKMQRKPYEKEIPQEISSF